jgi:hypothetical protein
MVQLPVFDYLTTFLDPSEAKALVLVSLTFAPPDPRSLQERLLAMTRRVDAVWLQRIAMERDVDYEDGVLSRLSSSVWSMESFVKAHRRDWRRIVRAENRADALEEAMRAQM